MILPKSRGGIVVGASGAVSVHPSTGCHERSSEGEVSWKG
jgi:hypothetical protein